MIPPRLDRVHGFFRSRGFPPLCGCTGQSRGRCVSLAESAQFTLQCATFYPRAKSSETGYPNQCASSHQGSSCRARLVLSRPRNFGPSRTFGEISVDLFSSRSLCVGLGETGDACAAQRGSRVFVKGFSFSPGESFPVENVFSVSFSVTCNEASPGVCAHFVFTPSRARRRVRGGNVRCAAWVSGCFWRLSGPPVEAFWRRTRLVLRPTLASVVGVKRERREAHLFAVPRPASETQLRAFAETANANARVRENAVHARRLSALFRARPGA